MYIKNKTWQVNAQLIGNLKYLHAKHIIKGHKLIRQTRLTAEVHHPTSYQCV